MQFTDTSEKGFQKFITNYLVNEHNYIETKTEGILNEIVSK
jgi:CRISPR/Cas system-associated protein Cas10 (large subunit of type III CRISPR-Cas system)